MFLLLVLYVCAVLSQSHATLLWHDEIFTFYIAQAPTWREMLADTRSVDLNPPLSYLLTRLSFKIFHAGTLAARLPEMAAFPVAMLSLFSFVKRRSGVLFGFLASAILFSSLAGELAVDARPYALLLASVCVSLLGWQRARERGAQRSLGIALLLMGGFGLLLSHIFGLLSWSALAAGEIFRTRERRRPDWPLLFAWTLPLISVWTYLPMLRNHRASSFPLAFQPTGEDIFVFYFNHIDRELVIVWLTAVLVLLLLGRESLRGSRHWFLTSPEWVSVIGLLAVPAILIGYLMSVHGAFFPRYGVCACVGAAVLASVFLCWWTRQDHRAALLGAVVALLISGQAAAAVYGLPYLLSGHPFPSSEPVVPPCHVCRLADSIDPSLPLVAASGLTFLEMDHRESAHDVNRLFYLTDQAAALEYAHASIFEGMGEEARIFPIRAHVETYQGFLQQHRHFFVFGQYAYPEDWLLRKLTADGASVRIRGTVSDSYKDHELYEVTL